MTHFPEIARLKVGESHVFPYDRTVPWVFWMRVSSACNRLAKKVGDGSRFYCKLLGDSSVRCTRLS